MEASTPILSLPHEILHQILLSLPLRQLIAFRCVSKSFHQLLSSPPFLSSPLPLLSLIALPIPTLHPSLHVYDPDLNHSLHFPLAFLPFPSLKPIASSLGLLYLWAQPNKSIQSLVVCNPLTRQFRTLPSPALGSGPARSAWSGHLLIHSTTNTTNRVMIITQTYTAIYSSNQWTKIYPSNNLPSKPKTPVLISNSIYALCDVGGSPWRTQWKLYSCSVGDLNWGVVGREQWGEVLDIMKRPRLVAGIGGLLMVGGLKSCLFSMAGSCSAIVALRLDLETWEWDEAGRMPGEMFGCFGEKFGVFGCGDWICFSGKGMDRVALWDCGKDEWRWICGVRDCGPGFLFQPRFTPLLP